MGSMELPGVPRWRVVAGAAVVVGYLWVAGGLRSFTWQAAAATGVGAVAVLAFAWRCRSYRSSAPADRPGLLVWSAWLAAVLGWELWALAGKPRADYPTLSSIADPLLDSRPGRSAAVLGWLVIGWWLARLRPAPDHAPGLAAPDGAAGLAVPDGTPGLAAPDNAAGLAASDGAPGSMAPDGTPGLAVPGGAASGDAPGLAARDDSVGSP